MFITIIGIIIIVIIIIIIIIGWHYLSNATCLMPASFVLCVLGRVKAHNNSNMCWPLLKKPCVRQVALDQYLPPMQMVYYTIA